MIQKELAQRQDHGYRKIAKIGNNINGIYIFSTTIAIVHSENELYEWTNFPNTPNSESLKKLFSEMNNIKTSFNKMEDKLSLIHI